MAFAISIVKSTTKVTCKQQTQNLLAHIIPKYLTMFFHSDLYEITLTYLWNLHILLNKITLNIYTLVMQPQCIFKV